MKDWQKELAGYLTGTVTMDDAATFALKHKDFSANTGYNLLGQYQGSDNGANWYVWVQVAVPKGYSLGETKQITANLFASHIAEFGDAFVKNYWEDGVLLGVRSNPDAVVEKIKAIKSVEPYEPENDDDDNRLKLIVIGVIVLLVLVLVFEIAKK